MHVNSEQKRVFVYGYYGRKNCGDDAMLYAFLEHVSEACPNMEFHVLTGSDPPRLPKTAAKRTFLVPSTGLAVAGRIARSNSFAIVGGTHLTDYGFGVRTVAIMARIFLMVSFATLIHKPVYLIGAGIGPFSRFATKLAARLICMQATAISVRDQSSLKVLKGFGLIERTSLAFDISVLTQVPSTEKRELPVAAEPILGVSITPMFSIYHNSRELDRQLVDRFAEALNSWMERHSNWHVQLFAFHGRSAMSRNDDVAITWNLHQSIEPKSRVSVIEYDSNPVEFLDRIGKCSAFVGMKFHSCVFAYRNNVPLIVIPYHPKCAAFAEEIGLSGLGVVEVSDVLSGGLGKTLEIFFSQRSGLSPILPIETSRMRAKAGLVSFVDGESK